MEENGFPPSGTPAEAGPARPTRSALHTTLSWARDLTLSVVIAVVLIVFIYQPVKVEGTSMEPSLTDQERIFINKFTYEFGLGQIERGDTVVFWYPNDHTKSYIKRVVALPGERVRIDAGQVYVNDRRWVEDYVPQSFRDTAWWPPDERGHDHIVPPGNYFVLGDNRSQSSDSRAWGYVPRELIYGKAVFIYWPLEKLGRLQ
jgi:signal peptidase I